MVPCLPQSTHGFVLGQVTECMNGWALKYRERLGVESSAFLLMIWLAPGMAASAVSIWVCACEWGFSRKVLWAVGGTEKHYINDVHPPSTCTSLVFSQSDLSSPRPTYTSIPICLQSGNIGQFLHKFGSRIEGDHRPRHKHTSARTHKDLFLCVKSNLLARPRWKEHYVYPVVCFHSLCDSSLMLLTEINRAFNSHSSGSCASNYAAYAIKHSKYRESHRIILRTFWPGGNPSDKGTEAEHNTFILSLTVLPIQTVIKSCAQLNSNSLFFA